MSCDFTHCEWRLRGQRAEAELDRLRKEDERLRGWVKMAYFEGHADAQVDSISAADDWKGSEARAALEEE